MINKENVGLITDAGKFFLKDKFLPKKSNSIFIWIPKNAGTSFYNALKTIGFAKLKKVGLIKTCFNDSGRVTFGHISVRKLIQNNYVSDEFFLNSFKFAVSRNPYSRFVSIYNYYMRTGLFDSWHKKPSIEDFFDLINLGYFPKVGLYHHAPLSMCNLQSSWVDDLESTTIVRLEHLNHDIGVISDAFEVDLATIIGKSNKSSGVLKSDLSRILKTKIEAFYAEDFENFNY